MTKGTKRASGALTTPANNEWASGAALVDCFVQLVRDVPQVKRVLVDDSGRYPTVPEALVDWDLVNLGEYPGVPEETILPSGAAIRLAR